MVRRAAGGRCLRKALRREGDGPGSRSARWSSGPARRETSFRSGETVACHRRRATGTPAGSCRGPDRKVPACGHRVRAAKPRHRRSRPSAAVTRSKRAARRSSFASPRPPAKPRPQLHGSPGKATPVPASQSRRRRREASVGRSAVDGSSDLRLAPQSTNQATARTSYTRCTRKRACAHKAPRRL
jgi:hypothetical protein